jgi:hypothetical protein
MGGVIEKLLCHCEDYLRENMWVPKRNELTIDKIRKKYFYEERGTY